ncbi:MAG: sodium-dependent transporter [Gammaproteobacteria bacterium]|nr:sodium-dependent transporter [Gammaproteobacteria bacterium]MCY4324126.1 sodium-dependent transporter [Gammaproteobacteria bacterium]
MQVQDNWTSNWGFILAAIGGAVGLGNLWKFPYMAGENGGGAFVLLYLVAVVFIALPILVAELLLGRQGRASPPHAMENVARSAGASEHWRMVGGMGMLVGFIILTFYSVIGGWVLCYIVKAISGQFTGFDAGVSESAFSNLLASPIELTLWHGLFMLLTAGIVARGVAQGIERAVKVLMPALFVLVAILVVYSAIAGDFRGALAYLFSFDASKITETVVLEAIGQAFFSIGLAMGLMMIYGAYVPKSSSLVRSSYIIVSADTMIALFAGMMIFPIVFAHGLAANQGPGLIFVTLPIAFSDMPLGVLVATLFFVLLAFAALSSSISILEPAVAWIRSRFGLTRIQACAVTALTAFLIGLLSVVSFNVGADHMPEFVRTHLASPTYFDFFDNLTSNFLMPVGAILMSIFVGWRLDRAHLSGELAIKDGNLMRVWLLLLRYIVPLAILGILLVKWVI